MSVPASKRDIKDIKETKSIKEIDISELRSILGCTRRVFAQISGISERNVIRWERKIVKPNIKSHIILNKIEELCKTLVNIFGTQQKISKWLNESNKSLNGRTPIKQIISAPVLEEGIGQIIELLSGYKFGIAS
jgi:DNA-binding transcriptional regulator YiaG